MTSQLNANKIRPGKRNSSTLAVNHKDETIRVRHIYDAVANKYDTVIGIAEHLFFADGRTWVCKQARGDVLDIAIGTGRNLPYYPVHVKLTGIELSHEMLKLAHRRARALGRKLDLCLGDAQTLAFSDRSFDTVVFTLALCSIPDERQAIMEARRVLRPGGRLLLLEHVRSPIPAVRAVQRLLDPLFVRLQADHLLREPLDHLKAEDFEIECLERSKLGIVERLSARKPS